MIQLTERDSNLATFFNTFDLLFKNGDTYSSFRDSKSEMEIAFLLDKAISKINQKTDEAHLPLIFNLGIYEELKIMADVIKYHENYTKPKLKAFYQVIHNIEENHKGQIITSKLLPSPSTTAISCSDELPFDSYTRSSQRNTFLDIIKVLRTGQLFRIASLTGKKSTSQPQLMTCYSLVQSYSDIVNKMVKLTNVISFFSAPEIVYRNEPTINYEPVAAINTGSDILIIPLKSAMPPFSHDKMFSSITYAGIITSEILNTTPVDLYINTEGVLDNPLLKDVNAIDYNETIQLEDLSFSHGIRHLDNYFNSIVKKSPNILQSIIYPYSEMINVVQKTDGDELNLGIFSRSTGGKVDYRSSTLQPYNSIKPSLTKSSKFERIAIAKYNKAAILNFAQRSLSISDMSPQRTDEAISRIIKTIGVISLLDAFKTAYRESSLDELNVGRLCTSYHNKDISKKLNLVSIVKSSSFNSAAKSLADKDPRSKDTINEYYLYDIDGNKVQDTTAYSIKTKAGDDFTSKATSYAFVNLKNKIFLEKITERYESSVRDIDSAEDRDNRQTLARLGRVSDLLSIANKRQIGTDLKYFLRSENPGALCHGFSSDDHTNITSNEDYELQFKELPELCVHEHLSLHTVVCIPLSSKQTKSLSN
ncbi:hypothetical protein [Photobacterium kishitanii]|uniref:Uncharacterized protein n=1 Tax=Photobacterium kishitanii TaxID=318456 RepID=A0A2T3KLF8_9GAMM|nr:hypothetical protein [Photobacterium kishitanii]PSV00554.1 hypothetical protein C9J27_05310 [Photobacterium kishitanii]